MNRFIKSFWFHCEQFVIWEVSRTAVFQQTNKPNKTKSCGIRTFETEPHETLQPNIHLKFVSRLAPNKALSYFLPESSDDFVYLGDI